MLDRQFAQIHIGAFPHDFLAGRGGNQLGLHSEHLLQYRPFFPGIFQPPGRLRFLQEGEQLAHFAQRLGALLAHAQRHTARGTEQVGEHRHLVPGRIFEQHRRPLRAQHPVADFGHLQMRRNRRGHALEFADFFQLGDEIAQIFIFH